MNFSYAGTCFVYFEMKLAEYIEPKINSVCKNLKRFSLPVDGSLLSENDEVSMGPTLFRVYLILKEFSEFGNFINKFCCFDVCIFNFFRF